MTGVIKRYMTSLNVVWANGASAEEQCPLSVCTYGGRVENPLCTVVVHVTSKSLRHGCIDNVIRKEKVSLQIIPRLQIKISS